MRKQNRRKKTLGLSHDRVAGDACTPLLNRISTGFFHESDSPFVQLVRRHVRQLSAINLRNPRRMPAADVIKLLAPAFDIKNLRKNCAKAPAIILEGFGPP